MSPRVRIPFLLPNKPLFFLWREEMSSLKLIDTRQIGDYKECATDENTILVREKFPEFFEKRNGRLLFVGSNAEIVMCENFLAEKNTQMSSNIIIPRKDDKFSEKMSMAIHTMQMMIETPNLKRNMSIFAGNPGIGKSYEIDQGLREIGIIQESIKGVTSPVKAYEYLYIHKDDKVIIFDDCDGIFSCPIIVEIFKAVTDKTTGRWVSYNKWNLVLEQKVPLKFQFNSRIVLLTNENLQEKRCSHKKSLDALLSRAYYNTFFLDKDETLERIITIPS